MCISQPEGEKKICKCLLFVTYKFVNYVERMNKEVGWKSMPLWNKLI